MNKWSNYSVQELQLFQKEIDVAIRRKLDQEDKDFEAMLNRDNPCSDRVDKLVFFGHYVSFSYNGIKYFVSDALIKFLDGVGITTVEHLPSELVELERFIRTRLKNDRRVSQSSGP
jgi:hypothetical protein